MLNVYATIELTCVLKVRLILETIRADVEEFGGKAYRMGKGSKDDAVVALFKDQLDEFKQVQTIRLATCCTQQLGADTPACHFAMINQAHSQLHWTVPKILHARWQRCKWSIAEGLNNKSLTSFTSRPLLVEHCTSLARASKPCFDLACRCCQLWSS